MSVGLTLLSREKGCLVEWRCWDSLVLKWNHKKCEELSREGRNLVCGGMAGWRNGACSTGGRKLVLMVGLMLKYYMLKTQL